jgi:VIT1/CCC1 family predicted Fe2+/Mn2+ transporter
MKKLGEYIGDLVYGANDGIITTFAVVSGVAGAALSPGIVVILGVANLIADGLSMAASNYLARKSEKEYLEKKTGVAAVAERHPLYNALATFAAFVVAGAIPLVPYVLSVETNAFSWAILATSIALFGRQPALARYQCPLVASGIGNVRHRRRGCSVSLRHRQPSR